MQLLFRTWNHIIPLAIVTNKTLKQGDVVQIKNQIIISIVSLIRYQQVERKLDFFIV